MASQSPLDLGKCGHRAASPARALTLAKANEVDIPKTSKAEIIRVSPGPRLSAESGHTVTRRGFLHPPDAHDIVQGFGAALV